MDMVEDRWGESRSDDKSAESVVEPRAQELGQESGLLEQVADETKWVLASQAIELPSGRRVTAEVAPEGEQLRIESPTGDVELLVTMTERGPLLRFKAADVQLGATRDIHVDCERFVLRAKDGIEHRTAGDLEEVVGGNRITKVRKLHACVARDVAIDAARGTVKISANDDVQLAAERVRLNC